MTDHVLDLCGLKCPLPALRTRKALREARAGDRLAVACTEPLARLDIPNLVRETGDLLEGIEDAGDVVTFRIRKAGRA